MEASKRERIILLGVVPVVAAIVGAIVTVVVARITGSNGNPNDAVMAIVKDTSLTFNQKAKLMQLVNDNTSQFYSWLSGVGSIVLFSISILMPSIAQRIRGE